MQPFFTRKILVGLVLVAAVLLLVIWQQVSLIPISDNHRHGDPSTEDHLHTHDGTFSHGHSHFGLPGNVTHSHPHVHEHEHPIDDKDPSLDRWEQVGHVHQGDDAAIFLAKCEECDLELTVSIQKYFEGVLSACDSEQKFLHGKIVVGNQPVEELLFHKTSVGYVAELETKLIEHPLASLVVSNLRIDEQDLEFSLPVLRRPSANPNTDHIDSSQERLPGETND